MLENKNQPKKSNNLQDLEKLINQEDNDEYIVINEKTGKPYSIHKKADAKPAYRTLKSRPTEKEEETTFKEITIERTLEAIKERADRTKTQETSFKEKQEKGNIQLKENLEDLENKSGNINLKKGSADKVVKAIFGEYTKRPDEKELEPKQELLELILSDNEIKKIGVGSKFTLRGTIGKEKGKSPKGSYKVVGTRVTPKDGILLIQAKKNENDANEKPFEITPAQFQQYFNKEGILFTASDKRQEALNKKEKEEKQNKILETKEAQKISPKIILEKKEIKDPVATKTSIENNKKLVKILAEKGHKDTAKTTNKETEVKEEKEKNTEDKEFEEARKKINENIEKTVEEETTKFEEKIKAIYEKTEKLFKAKEKEGVVEKNPEQKLVATRVSYAEGYIKFIADRKENSTWYVNLKRKIFGSKIKEGEASENLLKLEQEYEKATIEHGKDMYAKKNLELKNSKLSIEEQEAELIKYKGNEIYTEIIVKEGLALNALIEEKDAAWKKILDSYSRQNRLVKIAISTILTTSIVVAVSSSSAVTAGGVASYAASKYVRGLTGSIVGQGATKAYDMIWKDTSTTERETAEKGLAEIFSEESFDTSFSKTKKEYEKIAEKERKVKNLRMVTKAVLMVGTAVLTSYEMGQVSHSISPEHTTSNGNLSSKPTIAEHSTESIKPGFKIEKVDFSPKGAIQTIHDLKAQINHNYPDISKAPTSMQEFMKTNSTAEAIKLGLYDPNSPTESAILLKGSTLGFDQQGNLSVHDMSTNQDSILVNEAGDVPKIEKYHGQMFDPSQKEVHIAAPANQVISDAPPVEHHHIRHMIEDKITKAAELEPTGEILHSLTSDQLQQLNQINQVRLENLKNLFGRNDTLWNNVKDSHSQSLSASKMMNLNTEGMTEETKKLVSYLNKLHDTIGLEPQTETIVSFAETNSEYINRSLEKAAEMGILDEVKV